MNANKETRTADELRADLARLKNAGPDQERQLQGQLRKAERDEAERRAAEQQQAAAAALDQALPLGRTVDAHLADAARLLWQAAQQLKAARVPERQYDALRVRHQLHVDQYALAPAYEEICQAARELARQLGSDFPADVPGQNDRAWLWEAA